VNGKKLRGGKEWVDMRPVIADDICWWPKEK
jgi:hypothetical protein